MPLDWRGNWVESWKTGQLSGKISSHSLLTEAELSSARFLCEEEAMSPKALCATPKKGHWPNEYLSLERCFSYHG